MYFDDITCEVDGAVLFTDRMADIEFILDHRKVDRLLVHCYAGQSRSRTVGAFATKMFHADNSKYFTAGNPNMHVYHTLVAAWARWQGK